MVERFLPGLDADEERHVADFMSALATATAASVPPLQGADAVWVRAHLLSRWEAERRAQRPLDAMERVQIGLGLVAAVVLFVWSTPLLMSSFDFMR
jgi:hypothetical protein